MWWICPAYSGEAWLCPIQARYVELSKLYPHTGNYADLGTGRFGVAHLAEHAVCIHRARHAVGETAVLDSRLIVKLPTSIRGPKHPAPSIWLEGLRLRCMLKPHTQNRSRQIDS